MRLGVLKCPCSRAHRIEAKGAQGASTVMEVL